MDALSKGAGDAPSFDVVLVSLPFGVLHSPSLALGILQARLKASAISVKCRHFTLDYAARTGPQLYNKIAAGFPRNTDLLGEWIFSHALSRKKTAQQLEYLARTFGPSGLDFHQTSDGIVCTGTDATKVQLVEAILRLAATVGEFIDYAAHEILSYFPKVVGLTTVFQQNLATIAVAARIRQLDPTVKIVLGGANCEGPMGQELTRNFQFVDFIISGEADSVIVPLIQSLLKGEDPLGNLHVRQRVESATGSGPFIQTKIVADFNDYVSPSFDDYFNDLGRLWIEPDIGKVHIPLETSRGCWWGMKNHCTFCGLNGSSMSFRSRRPADALQEIIENATKYPEAKICFVDNIMDYKYFDLLLPSLAQAGAKLSLFYEIKSNVTKSQVKALAAAGVKHVQPGIESLSDQVLEIMKKGVKAVQNIQLLKWCMEFGVAVDWNLLWGFPGESPAEYQNMAGIVPLICHLQPPARGSKIRLDRFSPNFTRSSDLGFLNVRPYEAYYDIYEEVPRESVFNLSYFFEAEGKDDDQIEHYTRILSDNIERWKLSHATNSLMYLELEGRVIIADSRSMLFGRRSYLLDPLESNIFLLCDRAHSISSMARKIPNTPLHDITRILDGFCAKGTMWFDGEQYVSLAVSLTTFLHSRGTANTEATINQVLSRATASPASSAMTPLA